MLRICLGAAVALLSIGVAQAGDYRLAGLEIMTPWARATAPTAPAGGGFAVIRNGGPAAGSSRPAAPPRRRCRSTR